MNNSLIIMQLIVLIVNLMSCAKSYAEGHWERVRRADWNFDMDRIYFVNEERGWILGNHRELLYTVNGGQDWHLYNWTTEIEDSLQGFLEDFCFIDTTNIWLVGSDGIVLHSDDGGGQWQFQNSGTVKDLLAVDFADRKKGCATGRWGIIIYTEDSGKTWNNSSINTNVTLNDVCFVDSLTGWIVGTEGTILNTVDGGKSWNVRDGGVNNILLSVYFADKKHGWAVGWEGIVLRTTDGGETWPTKYFFEGEEMIFTNVEFIDKTTGWITGGRYYQKCSKILKTTDGGESWIELESRSNTILQDIFFVNNDKGWAVGDWGTIMNSADGGESWHWQVENTAHNLSSVYFIDESTGWASGSMLIKSIDGGYTWSTIDSLEGNEIIFVGDKKGWLTHTRRGIYNTNDGGETWKLQFKVDEGNNPYKLFFINELNGWALSSSSEVSELFHTNDGGNYWEAQVQFSTDLYALCFSDSSNGWLAGNFGKIFHTIDGGNNWEQILSGQYPNEVFRDIVFPNKDTGWIIGYFGNILNTSNGGQSWELQYFYTSDYLTSAHFVDANNGWISGGWGALLHTTDGGVIWDDSHSEYPGNPWFDIFFTEADHGWVVGYQGGINKWIPDTKITMKEQPQVPFEFAIHQNYPNPFNPKTEIRFQLPESGHVTLTVYNLLGQKIRTLKNEKKQAGYYSVRWDGCDENGVLVASGVYVYIFQTSKFMDVRKMVLLR